MLESDDKGADLSVLNALRRNILERKMATTDPRPVPVVLNALRRNNLERWFLSGLWCRQHRVLNALRRNILERTKERLRATLEAGWCSTP